MKEIKKMSGAELMCELIDMPQAPLASEITSPYDAVRVVPAIQTYKELVERRLAVAKELLLRDLVAMMKKRTVMGSPNMVRDWLKLHCARLEHEVFLLLHLDVRNRLIAAEEIFRGTLTHTSIYPREVLKSALAHNAATVLLAHNHPSGNAEPSQSDMLLTKTLLAALALVDVRVADHFIVAGDCVLSFAEEGLL